MIAEDDKVALQIEGRFPLKNGRLYNNFYHMYFQVRDGKVAVLKEYHDSLHFVDVFAGSTFTEPRRHTSMFDLD
jgi:ketosteroid isomerase-like protein